MSSTSNQVNVNDAIVEFDKLLVGLNMLYEEITTRRDEMISQVNVEKSVNTIMYDDKFRSFLVNLIRDNYGDVFYRDVAHKVMQEIDADIEAFINSRVNSAITAAGLTPAEASR